MTTQFSNIIAFDDAPFPPDFTGKVLVVGAVFAGLRFDGVLIGEVQKDGDDAAARLETLLINSKFMQHVQLVMLQGIALAGFNVVDVFALHQNLNRPVLVVSRREPDMTAIHQALLEQVPQGKAKWALIEKLGPMEKAAEVFIQRVGLTYQEAETVISRFAIHGSIPEPLRAAHLIAGALADGESRGRV